MPPLNITFELPTEIDEGLSSGKFERIGGVIREVASKQVIAWLRELSSTVPQGASLSKISQILPAQTVLSLGISTVGFGFVIQRLGELEKRLQKLQKQVEKIDEKIELGFYANFRAALDLAINAFRMSHLENRRSSALQAINRFLEAEHFYSSYTDRLLEQGSEIAAEYLLTLSLSYIAEIRCYLELEELDTAQRRFQEGVDRLLCQTRKSIELLLTSNPAVYLQPKLKDQINLRRLTQIYQWINPEFDENSVFNAQRENLFNLARDLSIMQDSVGIKALRILSSGYSPLVLLSKDELLKKMRTMELIIENCNRFEAYATEVKAIFQLGMSFQDWLKLAPTEPQPEGSNLMYIIPSEPLAL
ncbi:hypothetical protein K9N68_05230 [Kovacikia minuta CCNUW1]|uniref:hypothetical protein n=1 Tax=Kovacikia minuta TaxID=2931930 RepID=UPI001CCE31A5|nr:hypothetical protein [Kovacikia minuta]UBF27363.1 hypothetical protein K9N68_05230 [Kovacikia minuta CCNUW1]